MNPRDINPRNTADVPAPETCPSPIPAETVGGSTQRALAEAVKLVAEANESRARQLHELEAIATWLQRGLVAEAARLKQLESDLLSRGAATGKTIPPASALASALEGGAEAQRERARAQAALEQLQAASARLEKARGEAASLEQENHRLRQEAERWQTQLWLAAVRGDAWRAWRERLVEHAAAEGPAAMLFARLHLAAALERAGRPLPLELVRDLGRSVYEAGVGDAEKLAQALTQAAAGRFEIRIVRVGDRIDNKFMKPSAGGLVEVRAVGGWAVRDQNGLWQFPAEVS